MRKISILFSAVFLLLGVNAYASAENRLSCAVYQNGKSLGIGSWIDSVTEVVNGTTLSGP